LTAFAAYEVLVLRTGWRGPMEEALGLSYAVNIISPHLVAQSLWHLWSLASEEQFYLLWPVALIFLIDRLRRPTLERLLCIGAGLLATQVLLLTPYLGPLQLWNGSNLRAAGLLFGCAAGSAHMRGVVFASKGLRPVGAATLAASGVVFWDSGIVFLGVLLFDIGAVVLMMAILEQPERLPARLLGNRGLGIVGRTSYGMYLWHLPLLYLFGHSVIPAYGLSAAVVAMSYRFLEQPMLTRFIDKRPRLEPVTT